MQVNQNQNKTIVLWWKAKYVQKDIQQVGLEKKVKSQYKGKSEQAQKGCYYSEVCEE